MITFETAGQRLLLVYEPEGGFGSADWVDRKLHEEGHVVLAKTFMLSRDDLLETSDSDVRTFLIGTVEKGYYRIKADVLGLKHDLYLSLQVRLHRKTFIAPTDISIFARIDSLTRDPIVVGGEHPSALSLGDFSRLLSTFPTTTELKHYARARLSRVLEDHFGATTKAEEAFNNYLNKRTATTNKRKPLGTRTPLREYELRKFRLIREELREMLKDSNAYSENVWQTKIADLLLLLFPKYVAVLEKVQINDYYSAAGRIKKRFIDLVLVDANGAMDIIEIKKPFDDCILSKATYRDNHTPKTELAGAIMQVEQYLFHLSKWGRDGESTLQRKHAATLPKGVEIKVTNPKGLIILGRDSTFAAKQRFDFEIIRRKYANILDIMTYDDLLRRLDGIIARLEKA